MSTFRLSFNKLFYCGFSPNISSKFLFNTEQIFLHSDREGLCTPFSIRDIVCLVTPTLFASSF
ncbi:conserved hypothetical protein [Staphylococcus aureus A5937]|nr:conserved hypothetical protein [Staphylococcus aureus A5937]BAB94045.1 hypothetical protein [Staphylococcus aureus subsp. aureus MW2]CAG41948.1 hypothetical protein SAS0180 [Staphylococcus aureus subsp. aureus MSSA476]